ncbi:hypothetical protein PCL_10591 [Purpureocillium lilacinum]|uniref:Uncharacterized protein n=1 Tax=Purpureocillium lilacinum TaxID=33203 RepID=A0A2U3EBU1_PURLI|nr:hypothetical protein PCL_10591 [Purpureocillium lilacinum]
MSGAGPPGRTKGSTDNCVSSLRILVSPVPHTCAEGAGMALVMAAMPRRSGRASPTHAVVESRVERMNGGPGAVASRGSRHGGVRPARTTGEPQASGGVLHHGTGFRSGAPAPAPRLVGDRDRPPNYTRTSHGSGTRKGITKSPPPLLHNHPPSPPPILTVYHQHVS